jgi:hypothetical protein
MSPYRQPGRRVGTPMAEAPPAPWWALRRRLRWVFRDPCRSVNPGRVDRFDEISEQLYQLRKRRRRLRSDHYYDTSQPFPGPSRKVQL